MDFSNLFNNSNKQPTDPDFSTNEGMFKQQNAFLFQEAFFKMMLSFCFCKIIENSNNPEEDKEYLITSWRQSVELNMDVMVKAYEELMQNPTYRDSGIFKTSSDMKDVLLEVLDEVEDSMRKLLESFH